jgi:hypothetical protein
LYGYIPEINGVITALDQSVAGVVQAGGWSGVAATAFTQAWETDPVSVSALGVVIAAIAEAIDTLAVNLTNLDTP